MLDRLPAGARVAVLRLRSLGDAVLTTPAIRLLKSARPDLEISVVIEPRFAEVYQGNPDVAAMLDPAIDAVRRFRPELVINFHGGSRSLWMTALSGARFRAGFAHHRLATLLYNLPIPRAQQILGEERVVHTAEHLASAMFYLGVPRQPIPRACLFAGAAEPANASAIVIHPFASDPAKTWPASRFVDLARDLAGRTGLTPVFIGGPGDDFGPFANFDTRPNQSLAQTKQLLASARLFIGNDSGPAHMAAAFGLPVVVFFGTSDPDIWYPWRTEHRLFRDLANVSVGSAADAALGLLLGRPGAVDQDSVQ